MIKFIATQKFRFDLGTSFMSIINFAFIVIAASDKLSLVIHIPLLGMIAILVPSAILLVWFLGFILDKLSFFQHYQAEQNHRNEMLKEVHQNASK